MMPPTMISGDHVNHKNHKEHSLDNYSIYFGMNLNFCPPIEASYINPPFAWVNTITPSRYFTLVEAPLVTATAEACAENSNPFSLNRLSAASFSKKMTSLYFCPPN